MSDSIHCPNNSSFRKVMLVVDTMCLGGKERVVLLLARGLSRLGYDVVIATIRHLGEFGEVFEKEGGQVFAANSSHGFDPHAIGRLRKFIRQFQPDVINIHDRSSLLYTQLAAMGLGAKTVMTCHGLLETSQQKIRFDQQWAADRLDATTAVAQEVADDYIRLLQLRGLVDVITNGIEPIETSVEFRQDVREELGVAQDDYVCLSIGNVKPAKAYENLIDAASSARTMLSDVNMRFIIAGGAEDKHYLATLKDRIEEHNLEKTVEFIGPVSDVTPLYSAADCFVMSSKTEGLPMSLLEAMSAGVPVVSTDVGGIGKVIDQQCGMLCPAGKPKSIAAAIHKIVSEPELAHQLAENAKHRLEKKYSLEQMACEYVKLFESVCRTDRPVVVMASPLPPLEGGMASVAMAVMASLKDEYKVLPINTGKLTSRGRSFWVGVKSQLQLRKRILRDVKNNPGCLFHIHTCSGMTFWRDGWLSGVAKRAGAKTIMHIHGANFLKFLSQLCPIRKYLAKKILERCDAVIMLGESLREKMIKLDIAPAANYVVVRNGIEVGDEIADEAGATFLFLGNYGPRKGAAEIIDAAAVARDNGVDLRITLAGPETKPGQRAELQKKIDSLDLSGKVELVGLLKGGAKQKALLHSAALVLPSYREAQPVAILEAMAVGLPVISTTVGDIPAVVREGIEGLLIEPGDINALAKAMMKLETDEEYRMTLATNARKQADNYSTAVAHDELVKVYESLLEEK